MLNKGRIQTWMSGLSEDRHVMSSAKQIDDLDAESHGGQLRPPRLLREPEPVRWLLGDTGSSLLCRASQCL